MQVMDIRYLKRISTSDMVGFELVGKNFCCSAAFMFFHFQLTWVVTCIAVILTDVDLGLVIGLSFSFLTVVIRNQT